MNIVLLFSQKNTCSYCKNDFIVEIVDSNDSTIYSCEHCICDALTDVNGDISIDEKKKILNYVDGLINLRISSTERTKSKKYQETIKIRKKIKAEIQRLGEITVATA
jgi:hypothetical protein